MSHFTVMVRLPSSVGAAEIEERLAEALFPYKERGNMDEREEAKALDMGLLEFVDHEDERRQEYENNSNECVVVPPGKRIVGFNGEWVGAGTHSKYDDRFCSHKDGIGISSGDRYEAPAGATLRDVPNRERWPTFEAFMEDYHDEKPDPRTGRYGYWTNPKGYWDWYAIGGRWRGRLPLKPVAPQLLGKLSRWDEEGARVDVRGKADMARISDLDWDAIAVTTREKAAEFWSEWNQFISGKEFPVFDGPRETALALGWLDCLDADQFNVCRGMAWQKKWERQRKQGVDCYDVVREMPKRDEWRERVEAMFSPVTTFALLDHAKGWSQPGKMGWWACDDASPGAKPAAKIAQLRWLREGDQNDWIVMVDCHV